VKEVAKQLSRHGTPDSQLRKQVILLTAQACGRTSEVATLSWNLLEMDDSLRLPVFTWTQMKTSKRKYVLVIPSGTWTLSCD
jgi:hypothetical protein